MKFFFSIGCAFAILLFYHPVLFAQTGFQRVETAPSLNESGHFSKKSLRLALKDYPLFLEWQKRNLPHLLKKEYNELSSSVLLPDCSYESYLKLLECPHVLFIDLGERPVKEEREVDISGTGVNKISTIRQLLPQLNGSGMNVSIKEKAFDKTDIDFKGRVMDLATFPDDFTTHATSMATLVAGGGNSSPYGKGVAWQANLYTASFTNLMPDDIGKLTGKDIYVQNHSYGVAIENYYGIETQAYDQQCYTNPSMLHVFSAGNSGTLASNSGTYAGIIGFANLTAQFKMSKNTLSVGEIDGTFNLTGPSSRGPAYDGRLKPEITAYGGGGSSESAALVSGIALLIQQAYKNIFNSIPASALVKAVLLNSAEDLGRPEVDFEYGFGKADAYGAVKTILDNRFINGQIIQGQQLTYTITVPANVSKVKVTLVWNDPPANTNANKALINDLDLDLFDPTGNQSWKPWILSTYPSIDSLKKNAYRGIDRLNNVEQVTLENPQAGQYQIRVKGFSLQNSSQNFSIVYEFETGMKWVYPTKTDYVQANKGLNLNWEFYQNSLSGKIEYQYTANPGWRTIANLDDLRTGRASWTAPDTLALIQFRISGAGISFVSDTILVSKAISPAVGYNCTDELMLYWKKNPQANSYNVYKMGDRYLELMANTKDTVWIVNKKTESSEYFAVSSVVNQLISNGPTIDYVYQSVDCYFKNLLVTDILADTIVLDLSLSSNYKAKSLILQRLEGGVFQPLNNVNNINKTNWEFKDTQPLLYNNKYRVLLNDSLGRTFYSNVVEAFFVPKDQFLLYPNPAISGDDINIIGPKNQVVKIIVYNSQGEKLKEYNDINKGDFLGISSTQLRAGEYFVALFNDSGLASLKRLIVL